MFFCQYETDHFRVHLWFDLYNDSEIEWKNRLEMMSFEFKVVLCRIRLTPNIFFALFWKFLNEIFIIIFQKIIEKSSGVVDESLKYVEAGVNLVSEDVQELSQAIVEDTQGRFTNLAFWLVLIMHHSDWLIWKPI